MDVGKIKDPKLKKALQRRLFVHMGGGYIQPEGKTPGTTNQENEMIEKELIEKELRAFVKKTERRLDEIREVVENSKPQRVDLGFTPKSTLTPTNCGCPGDVRHREDTSNGLGFVPKSTLTPTDRRS